MRAAALLLLVAYASAPHADTCYWAFGALALSLSAQCLHCLGDCSLSAPCGRTEACLC